MGTVINFLILILSMGLIVGLIKPQLILKNSKKHTRLKIFGIWFLGMMMLTSIGEALKSDEEKAIDKIEAAKEYMQKEDYQSVVDELKDIDDDNPHYAEAQALFQKADSINRVTPEEREATKRLEEATKLRNSLENYVKEIDDYDFSKFRGSIELLEGELIQFAIWGKLVEKGEASDDEDIQKLAKQLKTKVKRVQTREFPILRKNYTEVFAKKMWEEDITVSSNGTGHKYINLTGGIFAANKNKKKFQETIHKTMHNFRFNRVAYRWYKEQNEYDYYTVYEGKDSDLFSFEK